MRKTQSPTATLIILLALSVLIQGCAGIRIDRELRASPDDWLTYGGAPSRVNRSNSIIQPPLEEIWEYNALAGIRGTPLVKDSVALVATLNGELHAVNLSSGKRIDRTTFESAIEGTPVWDDQYAYVPCALGTETLACIGLINAERRWTGQYGPIESSPLVLGEQLYITTLDGILYCINKSNGTELWRFETADKETRKPIRSSPASDGAVITFGSDDGSIYAVERMSGKLRWKYQTGASVFATPIIAGNLCIVGSLDGWAYALDTSTGRLAWRYDAGSKIYAPAACNDTLVFFGLSDGRLLTLWINSGERVWTFSARSVINSAPLVVGDILYVGSMDRTLYALRTQTGEKLWQFDAPGRIRVSPVVWGNVLLLVSEDRILTAFRPVQQ